MINKNDKSLNIESVKVLSNDYLLSLVYNTNKLYYEFYIFDLNNKYWFNLNYTLKFNKKLKNPKLIINKNIINIIDKINHYKIIKKEVLYKTSYIQTYNHTFYLFNILCFYNKFSMRKHRLKTQNVLKRIMKI